jgi:DNA polymerase III alpha subunit
VSSSSPSVRVGLSRVFGLTHALGLRILCQRPFRSLADFVDRVRPTLPELESLVLAGALDWTGRSRPSLLLEVRVGSSPARATAGLAAERSGLLTGTDGVALMPEPVARVAVPSLPEFDVAQLVRGELQATGLWFAGHPLDVFVAPAALAGTVSAASLEAHAGRRVALAGLPCAWRRVETRSGGTMLFLSLADHSGIAECVLFPDAFRALAPAVRGQVVRVEGRVDETLGALTVNVARARALA